MLKSVHDQGHTTTNESKEAIEFLAAGFEMTSPGFSPMEDPAIEYTPQDVVTKPFVSKIPRVKDIHNTSY